MVKRRLYVVLATPEPGDDPRYLILTLIVGKQNLNTERDGLLLFETDIPLRTSPHRRYPLKMRLSLTSDSVMVNHHGTQEIPRGNYFLRRSQIQFRLCKLGDVPMELAELHITIQLGNRKLNHWTYLRWKREKNQENSTVVLRAQTIDQLNIDQ